MSDFNTVELVNDPRGFATLWLSREEKNNAFNAEMIRELIIALDQVQADAALRFLLVRGRGKHFSAGADLAWMQQSAELDYHTNLDDARELAELMYNAQNQQKQNKMQGLNTALGTKATENIYKPGTEGLVQGTVKGFAEGAGKGVGMAIAG